MRAPHRFDTSTATRIGSGGSADVFRIHHANGKRYAIKAFDTAELNAANAAGLLNEVRLLAALRHPHIVAYKDTFLTGDRQFVCVAMELLTGGTLADLIKRHAAARQHLPEPMVWRYFLQLATAVAHLHAEGVVHRDLKPCNCVFSDTTHGQLKLLDLGLARRLVLVDHTLSQAGTPAYAAPEVYNRQPMSFPVDVWSLGCILHELCALQPVFNGRTIRQLRAQVLLGVKTPLPEHYSSELRGLLAAMLQEDPAQRITMPQLLAHPAVAPRLAELQAQGLVGVAAAQGSGAGAAQAAQEPSATSHHASPRGQRQAHPGTLERLLELLPAPRHSSAAEELMPGPHAADPQLSAWYSSDPAAAQPKTAVPKPVAAAASPLLPRGRELPSHSAAALGALQLPSGLADGPKQQQAGASNQPTVVIHVDAFSSGGSSPVASSRRGNGSSSKHSSGGSSSSSSSSSSSKVPAPEAQPAHLPPASPAACADSGLRRQRSRSLPGQMEANEQEPQQPEMPAVLARLHPKFRKMAEEALRLEAMGVCPPRPTSTHRASPSGSPAKAPGSPQPASGRLSSAGASRASAAATPRTRPPTPKRCLIDARALEARIEEVKRCRGGPAATAAAMAAAVRASLAEHDAALLRHITEAVNSARSTPRATPRARAAPVASSEVMTAGLLSDELNVERSLSSCSSQLGTVAPSRLGRPLPPQQPEELAAAAEVAAAADSQTSSTAERQQQQSAVESQQSQQCTVEEQPEARKSKQRWSLKWLQKLRRRAAH